MLFSNLVIKPCYSIIEVYLFFDLFLPIKLNHHFILIVFILLQTLSMFKYFKFFNFLRQMLHWLGKNCCSMYQVEWFDLESMLIGFIHFILTMNLILHQPINQFKFATVLPGFLLFNPKLFVISLCSLIAPDLVINLFDLLRSDFSGLKQYLNFNPNQCLYLFIDLIIFIPTFITNFIRCFVQLKLKYLYFTTTSLEIERLY